MGDFEARVASTEQGEWLETTPEIIKIITRGKGFQLLNGEPTHHICYKGVLVCENGKSEEIRERMDTNLNNIKHGSTEARIVSGL